MVAEASYQEGRLSAAETTDNLSIRKDRMKWRDDANEYELIISYQIVEDAGGFVDE